MNNSLNQECYVGLNVAIQDEHGKQLEIVLDERNVIGPMLGYPSFSKLPMVASIDRYGDTIFNRIQMEQFLIEWSDITTKALSPDDRVLVTRVKELAEMVRNSVHLYLIFIGD
jgi:hypothetical protein